MSPGVRAIGIPVAIGLILIGGAAPGAVAEPEGLSFDTLGEFVDDHGVAEVRSLNADLSTTEITAMVDDPAVHLTPSGRILFIDDPITPPQSTSIPDHISGIALDDFLSLNSNPDSQRTIFLDFDGHTVPAETYWDTESEPGDPTVAGVYPAFSIDGDPAFSDEEKEIIIDAWAAVAEDYAPFNVNVTTEDPGDAAITRTDSSDLVFGTRALITEGTAEWNAGDDSCNCGGIAFGDVFSMSTSDGIDHEDLQPAFVFAGSGFDGKIISDIASHEVGHNLNLNHDGYSPPSPRAAEYFEGKFDNRNWAPIMGAGYYNGLVQWSNGDYGTSRNPASNTTENDVSLISAAGTPRRVDESNATPATAFAISATPTDGIISSPRDVDYFSAVVSDGRLGVYAYSPAGRFSNLDIKLTIYDSKKRVIFSRNSLTDMSEDDEGEAPLLESGMEGILNADLPNGTYYISLDGVGRSGAYSDYGSLGAYSIVTRTPTVSSIPTKGTPSITGTPVRGRILTARPGSWSSGVAITRQWLRDGVVISGATSSTYTLTGSDVGHKISLRIIAVKPNYRTAVVVSAKTRTVSR